MSWCDEVGGGGLLWCDDVGGCLGGIVCEREGVLLGRVYAQLPLVYQGRQPSHLVGRCVGGGGRSDVGETQVEGQWQ